MIDTNLMEIGIDLGVYTICNLILEDAGATLEDWQKLADLCAKDIQDKTSIPAEDFSLLVQPALDAALRSIKEKP